MVRLNLQLFAYTGSSIVDYLKSVGQDSSYNARKEIAKSLGISNYTGTASQNTQMLNTLRSGSGSTNTTATSKNNNNSNKNTNTTPTPTATPTTSNPTTPTFTGVDQSLVGEAYKPFTGSEEAEGYKTQRDEYAQSLENKINSGFQQSNSVTKAFEWLNGQAEYFKNGKTSWDDKIWGQLNKIENREDFEYDVDKDTLFQQALASAMGSGKTAMQDTIGQASALTGGYGSTYATSAGNQAYNDFIEDAYNNLPEYYNMALQAYQAEGEEMYNLLGIYAQMGEQEWNRNVDSYNLISDSANSQRNWEYGLYQDDITNTYNAMNMYDSFYQQKNTEDLELWKQNISNAWNGITLENTNYWNQTELDYKKDRDAVEDQQWKDTYNFNKDQADIAQSNWEKDYKFSLAAANAKEDEEGNVTVDYSGYINPDDVEVDENGNIIKIEGYNIADSGNSNTPSVNGFRTTTGDNFKITIGDNTYEVENEGKVTADTTLDSIKKGKTYGNITIANNGHAYIKQGSDYYRIGNLNTLFGGISTKSGYADLLLALQK